jgi:hypothetical protein
MNNNIKKNVHPNGKMPYCTLNLCVLILFFTLTFQLADAQRIRYVSTEPSGKKDGSSWLNASSDLHRMINSSKEGDQVWIATNVSKPTNFNSIRQQGASSGVKSYLMKLCTSKEANSSTFTLIDPHHKVRIPKYSFQVLHSVANNNPPVYLVIQIIKYLKAG